MKLLISCLLSFVFWLPLFAQDGNSRQLPPKDDTLVWFTNLPDGMQYAKQHKKYAVVYFEPENCETCFEGYTVLLQKSKDGWYSYNVKGFNQYYVLIVAQPKDTFFLKKAGVKRFPGTAVFTGDQKLLHYNYNLQLSEVLDVMPRLAGQMQVHFFNTYQPGTIRKSGFDTTMLVEHLQTFLEQQDIIYDLQKYQQSFVKYIEEHNANPYSSYPGLVAPPITDTGTFKANKPFEEQAADSLQGRNMGIAYDQTDSMPNLPFEVDTSQWDMDMEGSLLNFKIDTAFIIEALDSFVVKNRKGNHSVADLAIKILQSLDEHFCPYFVSRFLSPNDTVFKPTPTFSYLFDYLQKFKSAAFNKLYYSDYKVPLYTILSERLNNFIRFNQSEDYVAIREALLFQQQFTNGLPELEHLEKPLLISNLLGYSDKIDIDTLLNAIAYPYLDKIISAKPSLTEFIASLARTIGNNYRKELSDILWKEKGRTYEQGDRSYYPIYFKEKFSSLLNDVAWNIY